jgi:site-specific DNA recombinase
MVTTARPWTARIETGHGGSNGKQHNKTETGHTPRLIGEEQTMKAIGYIRVSTEEQSREGVSLSMQRAKIQAYAELNDIILVDIIEDAGISAKNITGRPGFQEALGLLYSGDVDGLIVWKLDRAFRSTQDALTVAGKLNKQGKALVSICEKLDTSSAIGEFFFTLMASLAQMERKIIGERTAAALQSKKARGERVGEIPFGYTLNADGIHLEENDTEQEIIERIHFLKAKGYSFNKIAAELNRDGYRTKKGRAWSHVQVSMIYRRAA